MIDITGNWRETDSFQDRLQTREPDLQDGERCTVRQRLSLPAGKKAVAATLNGTMVPFETKHSGDSDWVWIPVPAGSQGRLVLKTE